MDQLVEFVVTNWYLFLALAAVLAWIGATEGMRLATGIPQISQSEATRLYNRDDGLFVDIRSEAEFERGHLPEAMNVPQGNYDQRHKKLDRRKKKPVVVYCAQGTQSGRFAKKLQEEGFEQVYQLKGGFTAWQEAGLPVHTS